MEALMKSGILALSLSLLLTGCVTTTEPKRSAEPAKPVAAKPAVAPAPAPTTVAPPAPALEKPVAPPPVVESKSRQTLAAGLADYVNGSYPAAQRNLQAALDLGLEPLDQVRARKHLAFIHCVSGKTPQCRSEFAKALRLEPTMVLEPAEAGHPLWGPVFKAEKAKVVQKAPAKKK